VAKVGTSKAGGTISQQAVVHPCLAADARVNKQKNSSISLQTSKILVIVTELYNMFEDLCEGMCGFDIPHEEGFFFF
jgi:hypothetical protein